MGCTGMRSATILPAKSFFVQVGDLVILTMKTVVAGMKPPYPYGEEFIGQFLFALQLCWFPLLVSTVAFGFGAPGLQAANIYQLFGTLDRLGGFFVLASIREFAPFVTAVVVAGVAGTAITADLGARKPLGGFFATLFSNASVLDLAGSVIKCTLFGAIIAVVCCYKGMTASGGAAGVGRAVNEAVVIAFMGVFAFNYVFTQTLLATNPQLQTLR